MPGKAEPRLGVPGNNKDHNPYMTGLQEETVKGGKSEHIKAYVSCLEIHLLLCSSL